MFLTGLKRAAVALLIATVLANTALTVAAEQSITPMAGTECEAMARKISRAAGIQLNTKVGEPRTLWADFLPGFHGNACLMSGGATALNAYFDEVENKLNAVLSGWTPTNEFAADTPFAAVQGFAKDLTLVTCQNIVIAFCKVQRRR